MSPATDSPLSVHLDMRSFAADLVLPPGTDILRAREPEALGDVHAAVLEALSAPIGSAPLAELCKQALARTSPAAGAARPAPGALSVVVVVSDNTRPVPYHGDGDLFVNRSCSHSGWQVVAVLHRLSVIGNDHIAALDSGPLRGTPRYNISNQGSFAAF